MIINNNESKKNIKQNGFSLIELSIVIVIIGLIIAGIVGGQSLVRQAKIRSFISEINNYKVAIINFKLEYNAFPGDFNKAESYWGTESVPGGEGTINGDGNRQIDLAMSAAGESYRAWEHLSLSNLIDKNFSGVPGPSPNYYQPKVNLPESKLIGTVKGQSTDVLVLYYVSRFYYAPGLYKPSRSHVISNQNARAKDVYTIDLKIDDGLIDSGVVRGRIAHASQTCMVGNQTDLYNGDNVNNKYNLTNPDAVCTFYYKLEI